MNNKQTKDRIMYLLRGMTDSPFYESLCACNSVEQLHDELIIEKLNILNAMEEVEKELVSDLMACQLLSTLDYLNGSSDIFVINNNVSRDLFIAKRRLGFDSKLDRVLFKVLNNLMEENESNREILKAQIFKHYNLSISS